MRADDRFDRPFDPQDPAFWTSTWDFVVKEHHATRLHWDFRLQIAGVLKSWVLVESPSLDPAREQRARQVADHSRRGLVDVRTIPPGMYGAGERYLWDKGRYLVEEASPPVALARGELLLQLNGDRLKGAWRLFRPAERDPLEWLLQKLEDEHALHGDTGVILGQGGAPAASPSAPQLVLGFTEEEMRQSVPTGTPGRRRRRRRSY